ncbi:caspase, EACC1-associated type [Streptomyces sp. CA-135486]|uniref:caspase, EACC1-associated type n=1 Tax=Streptomyces sp. CA-135486 TaxID=3240049 RepID=UPI003D8B743A
MQPTPELPAERRLALVVATSTYADPSLRRLRAPAHDAAGLSDVLSDPGIGGFTVTQVIDRTAQDVRLAFEEFLAHRAPNDLVVVYVSCHGLVDARRRLYFAAADTRKDRLAATGVEAQWVLDQLDDCRARQQVVILDCCFSGAFAQRSKGETDLGLGERFHGHARGRVVLTASRATEYSFEGEPVPGEVLPGSVFTSALVTGIRSGAADTDHDGYISVDDAYAYAFDRLRADDVAQTPQRWLYGAEGEILLARSPAGVPLPSASLPDTWTSGLANPHPAIALGIVAALGEWLADSDPARALAARRALEQVADGDIPRVAEAARAQLDTGTDGSGTDGSGTPLAEASADEQPDTASGAPASADDASDDTVPEDTVPNGDAPQPVLVDLSKPADGPAHRQPRRLPLPRTRRGRVGLGGVAVLLAAAATVTPMLVTRINDPGPHGRYDRPRGLILVNDKPVTGSSDTGQKLRWKRTYTDGPMYAPVTGYASQLFGTGLLESVEDKLLTGTDSRLGSAVAGKVFTTIEAAAQKAAYEGLQGKQGAAVALDPSSGKILALASSPSYDPSKIAGASKADRAEWTALNSDKKKRMLNRALRQTYPPGSTLKVVTAAAALQNGLYSNVDAATDSPVPWVLPETTVQLKNEGGGACENASLLSALQYSCNTVFAKISNDLGNTKMRQQAAAFGFNKEITTPLPAVKSVYPADDGSLNALDGIGQGSTSVTPLQMAMVAAAVANEGSLMEPYLVASLRTADGKLIEQHKPKALSRPLSELNARKLQQMMEYVVQGDGPGFRAQVPGSLVGGKSGTAQLRSGTSATGYAWFISYARTEGSGSPEVAVAVVVEAPGGTGETASGDKIAAPIAKRVMEAVLRR